MIAILLKIRTTIGAEIEHDKEVYKIIAIILSSVCSQKF